MKYPTFKIGESLALVINADEQEIGIVELPDEDDEDDEAHGFIMTIEEVAEMLSILRFYVVDGKLTNHEGQHVH